MLSCRHGLIVLLVAIFALGTSRAYAQQMVSIAAEEVNFRSGPGTRYPAEWVLGRGFPLKIVGRRGYFAAPTRSAITASASARLRSSARCASSSSLSTSMPTARPSAL